MFHVATRAVCEDTRLLGGGVLWWTEFGIRAYLDVNSASEPNLNLYEPSFLMYGMRLVIYHHLWWVAVRISYKIHKAPGIQNMLNRYNIVEL